MREKVVFDLEVYKNYFLFGIKKTNKKTLQIELKSKKAKLDASEIKTIKEIISTYCLVGFNSNKFDIPILLKALTGVSAHEIYKASTRVIQNNLSQYRSLEYLKLTLPKNLVTIDLMTIDIARGAFISLKQYGARIHSEKIQDLPIDWDQKLSKSDMEEIRIYNLNDLDLTLDLLKHAESNISVRAFLTEQYGVDLTSATGSKIAESIIAKVFKDKGSPLGYAKLKDDYSIRYIPPKHIKFKDPKLRQILRSLKSIPLELKPDTKSVIKPDYLKDPIKIGGTEYQLGLGGIHAIINNLGIVPNKDEILNQPDVVSYYPSMILEYLFVSGRLGVRFLTIYMELYNARQAWKAMEAKLKQSDNKSDYLIAKQSNSGYKLILNALFGTYGNQYFKTFAPDLLMQITITGQLNLLMLIEKLESKGISVKSANTDSVLILHKKTDLPKVQKIMRKWEHKTKMKLDNDYLDAFFARDINSYMYISNKKASGIAYWADYRDVSKNIEYPIVYHAIKEFLLKNISFQYTINKCDDIREFISTRKSTSGATYKGKLVGKALRFYYSHDDDALYNQITQAKRSDYATRCDKFKLKEKVYNMEIKKWETNYNEWKATDWSSADEKKIARPKKPKKIYPPKAPSITKVSKSDYACPCMTLPKGYKIPDNLNRKIYIDLCKKHIAEIGWSQELHNEIHYNEFLDVK